MRRPAISAAFIDPRSMAPLALLALSLVRGSSGFDPIYDTANAACAALILSWCAADKSIGDISPSGKAFVVVLASALAIACLQLTPLPPEVWMRLPGRARLAEEYALLGAPPPWAPLSLAPRETFRAMLKFLPVLAIFICWSKISRTGGAMLAPWIVCLCAGAVSAFTLCNAALQRSRGDLEHSFEVFANPNHLGAFLVMALPFCAALAFKGDKSGVNDGLVSCRQALGTILGVLCLAGVAVSGSLAAYALSASVLVASFLVILRGPRVRWLIWLALGTAAAAVLVAISIHPDLATKFAPSLGDGPLSRLTIWRSKLHAIADYAPLGSGLGSFASIYPSYEDPANVTAVFVNHAHNDYLEIALECGLAGAVLAGIAVAYMVVRAFLILVPWNRTEPVRAAAALALLVPIAHSLVDYPMRTPAIAGLSAFCAALLLSRRTG